MIGYCCANFPWNTYPHSVRQIFLEIPVPWRQSLDKCAFLLTLRDQVIVCISWVAGAGFVGFKWSVGDGEMVGVDMVFSVEFECWHRLSFSVYLCY